MNLIKVRGIHGATFEIMHANDIVKEVFDSSSETKLGTIEIRIAKAEGDYRHLQTTPEYFESSHWALLTRPFGNGGIDPDCEIK